MKERALRWLLSAEAMGYLLVLSAVQVFIYGVTASLRSPDSPVFFWASLAALVLGLRLGNRPSKMWQAVMAVCAAGAAAVWLVGARMPGPLMQLGREVAALFPQVLQWLRDESAIQTGGVVTAWATITEATLGLWARFQVWGLGFQTNVRVNDALVSNLLWLFALWLTAAWMGWFTARRNAVLTLAPSLTVLVAVTSYSRFKVETVWFQVMILLLLMGVWNYQRHLTRWTSTHVDYSESIAYDNSAALIALVLVVGLAAYLTPSLSWRQVRDFFRDLQKPQNNQVAEALGLATNPGTPESTYTAVDPTLPRTYRLLGGALNSERVVMTVRTGELPPALATSLNVPVPRHYWRSLVYDRYVSTGWVSNGTVEQTLPPNSPLIPGLLKHHRSLILQVNMEQPLGRLLWSGALYSSDVPLSVEWRVRPTDDLFADQTALLQADIFAIRSPVASYRADVYISDASVYDLRGASVDYPEEIRNRYLPLSIGTPQRVLDLARTITQGVTNPYDKAKAIERYLRQNYPYDITAPAPPAGVDVADYFLFDLQRGYCDYYATAMVVLARANNLPARFVSGYSPGEYDPLNAQYIVRELNAHSWAEVYFPGYGWIEFEPTASLPEIQRADSPSEQAAVESEAQVAPPSLIRWRIERIGLWLSPLLLLVIVPLMYFAVLEKYLHARLAPAEAITRIYRALYHTGRPLAGAHIQGETPAEFVVKLSNTLTQQQNKSRLKLPYRGVITDLQTLTTLYHTALFRNTTLHAYDFNAAWRTWTHLRWRLWWARMQQTFIAARNKHRSKEQHV